MAEEAINDQDDPFKDLVAEELEETINYFCERLPNEVPEEPNTAVLMDIDAELSTNGDKPSDAEILAEVWGEAIQKEEDDINIVYNESPAPSSAFEPEKAMEVLQQLTLFCDEGEDLQKVLWKVNTYLQRVIAKRQKTVKDYFKLRFFWMMYFCIIYCA